MKYMILIHSDMAFWETLPEAEANRVLGNHYTVINETKASGELIRVEGLGNDRTFIEFRDGTPAVTDGPFGEVKEQLAGIFLDRRRQPRSRPGDRRPARRVRRRRDPARHGGCRDGDVTASDAVPADIEGLLRHLAPQVLAALARRNSQFDACEDAVQEALLSASQTVGR